MLCWMELNVKTHSFYLFIPSIDVFLNMMFLGFFISTMIQLVWSNVYPTVWLTVYAFDSRTVSLIQIQFKHIYWSIHLHKIRVVVLYFFFCFMFIIFDEKLASTSKRKTIHNVSGIQHHENHWVYFRTDFYIIILFDLFIIRIWILVLLVWCLYICVSIVKDDKITTG